MLLAGSALLLSASLAPSPAAADPPTAPGPGPGRTKMLITPAQLSRQLNDPRLVLLQVGVEKDYQTGHIPGARWFNLDWIEKEPSPLALELPDLAKLD